MYEETKSDYFYSINEPRKVLRIIDLNLGRMSVTNDIENVLTQIRKEIGKDIESLKIIYRDSVGTWDEVVPKWDGDECEYVIFVAT